MTEKRKKQNKLQNRKMEIYKGFVYILASRHGGALYIGVTNNLQRRMAEHKTGINIGFTYQYRIQKLVYFEPYTDMGTAIQREKQLKKWKRDWKIALIEKENPDWNDLSDEIGLTSEFIQSVADEYAKLGQHLC